MSAADELHERLFGFRPAKAGTAYERLGAIVMAASGWIDVVHNTVVQRPGKEAEHQLDVTARLANGEVENLIIECRDWNRKVDQTTLDWLVGRRDQLEADAAAVVTTFGFTEGARRVAVDEDIAMVVVRTDELDCAPPFVKSVHLTHRYFVPSFSGFEFKFADSEGFEPGTTINIGAAQSDRLLYPDGSPAETFGELLERPESAFVAGTFARSVKFSDGRLLVMPDGQRRKLEGISWEEHIDYAEHETIVEREGTPCLVAYQLDVQGCVAGGRLFVDDDLEAWQIEADGSVTPRGLLRDTA